MFRRGIAEVGGYWIADSGYATVGTLCGFKWRVTGLFSIVVLYPNVTRHGLPLTAKRYVVTDWTPGNTKDSSQTVGCSRLGETMLVAVPGG